ncbi:hypothetical protein SCUCBS95973_004353 [Sporothrix curviconia]|uniref:RRM domain-containing protein n=1 Tax=Sporothrix curviconia TaxID=1260050 RepID=A0ABP0BMZ4_9PEZI
MAFDPKHTAQFKAWLVKHLEALEASSRTGSDVDAEILAEYVVALLEQDTSSADARLLFRSEIYDFLKDAVLDFPRKLLTSARCDLETDSFVNDVFSALSLKSYLPGMPQPSKAIPPSKAALPKPALPPAPVATYQNPQAAAASYGHGSLPPPPPAGAYVPPANGAKKRSYNESTLAAAGPNGISVNGWGAYPQGGGNRAAKQPRRGGVAAAGRGGRGGGGRGHGAPALDFNSQEPFAPVPLPQYAPTPGTYPPGTYAPGIFPPAPAAFNPAAAAFQPGVPAGLGAPAPDAQLPFFGGSSPGPAHLVENLLRMQQQLEQALSSYNAFAATSADRIPTEFLNEEKVREHFSSFGTIVEVTLQPEHSVAIVRFGTPAAAQQAISSPKTIFDNRFVTVSSLDSGRNGEEHGVDDAREITPELDMNEFLRKQEAAQKDYEEKKRMIDDLADQQHKVDERLKDNLAKQLELRKKIVANMATVAARLKTGDSQTPGSDGDGGTSRSGSPGSSKSAAQMMQTELIRAQLATLETEAKLLGIDPDMLLGDLSTGSGDDRTPVNITGWPPRSGSYGRGGRGGRGRGGGSYSSRGGGALAAAYAAYTLDNRPRRVAVAGVDFTDASNSEALRQYLLGVGEFSAIDMTDGSATITFADRRTAEAFFYGLPRSTAAGSSTDGKSGIPGIDEPVELSWVAGAVPASSSSNNNNNNDRGSSSGTLARKDDNGAGGVGPFIMQVEDDHDHDHDNGLDEGEIHETEDEDRHPDHTQHRRQNMDFDVDDEGDWNAQ